MLSARRTAEVVRQLSCGSPVTRRRAPGWLYERLTSDVDKGEEREYGHPRTHAGAHLDLREAGVGDILLVVLRSHPISCAHTAWRWVSALGRSRAAQRCVGSMCLGLPGLRVVAPAWWCCPLSRVSPRRTGHRPNEIHKKVLTDTDGPLQPRPLEGAAPRTARRSRLPNRTSAPMSHERARRVLHARIWRPSRGSMLASRRRRTTASGLSFLCYEFIIECSD